MTCPLSRIEKALAVTARRGPSDVDIRGISYDSRAVKPGWLFAALPGIHTDGHRYIASAIRSGAAAVLCERMPASGPGPELDPDPENRVAFLQVEDSRTAMSRASAEFFGHPSDSLAVIGVTGTEGKSTTVYFTWQLLNLSGRRAGFFSTVMSDTGSGERPNPEHQTTPESCAVQGMLAAMRDSGCEFAVVEASSHGLSPRTARLADLRFDVGVMTNVTHEHLEFHGTWEQYRSDKANLFRALDAHDHRKTISGARRIAGPCGIANADDPSAAYFADAAAAPFWSFSTRAAAVGATAAGDHADIHARCALHLQAGDIVAAPDGISFTIREFRAGAQGSGYGAAPTGVVVPARLPVPGEFNVANALAACLAASAASGAPWTEFAALLPGLRPVRGRMSRVDAGQGFDLIIDYAHTPSSFQTVLPPLRASVKGRLICVFGSGGERDREKRPAQGRIAADHCDIVILADEDPRGEDSMALLEEIAAGCPELPRGERLYLIPDRHQAIARAVSLARPGDTVILLGKGHENSIIHADRVEPYDEESAARRALAALGFDS